MMPVEPKPPALVEYERQQRIYWAGRVLKLLRSCDHRYLQILHKTISEEHPEWDDSPG